MELLKPLLQSAKNLLFLDLEGTQYTHEIIAIGAVLVSCDEKYVPYGEVKTFKRYCLTNSSIGSVIRTMTGIDEKFLKQNGISYRQALVELNDFLSTSTRSLKILVYGNNDAKMVKTSYKVLENPLPFETNFTNFLINNIVDIEKVLNFFLRGKRSDMLSLVHLRQLLELPSNGKAHDPLNDAKDLYDIYKAFVSDKERMKRTYRSLLKNADLIPSPIVSIIYDLLNGKSVTPEDLERCLDNYFA